MDLDKIKIIDIKTQTPIKKRKYKTKYNSVKKSIKQECLELLLSKGGDVLGDTNCYGELNRKKRGFYWIKSYICIIFNKIQHKSGYDLPEDLIDMKWFNDHHEYFNGDFNVWTQSILSIGKGLFNNWYCIVYETGN